MGMAAGNDARGWYDLHCHVLPGMDDGCRDAEEALRLLEVSWAQGVCGIAATPHYDPRESIGQFLARREEAMQKLEEQIGAASQLPQLCLGAEAAYYPGLAYDEDLEFICLGNSRYLLLELPFSAWPSTVLRDIIEMIRRGITPVIAHVERYFPSQKGKTMRQLFELDVLLQVNAGALDGIWNGYHARRLLRRGQIDVLASDAHNVTHRPPNLGATAARISKGWMKDELENIRFINQTIFEAAMGQNR